MIKVYTKKTIEIQGGGPPAGIGLTETNFQHSGWFQGENDRGMQKKLLFILYYKG